MAKASDRPWDELIHKTNAVPEKTMVSKKGADGSGFPTPMSPWMPTEASPPGSGHKRPPTRETLSRMRLLLHWSYPIPSTHSFRTVSSVSACRGCASCSGVYRSPYTHSYIIRLPSASVRHSSYHKPYGKLVHSLLEITVKPKLLLRSDRHLVRCPRTQTLVMAVFLLIWICWKKL